MSCRLWNTSGQQHFLLFFFLGSIGRNKQKIKFAHWCFKVYHSNNIIKHLKENKSKLMVQFLKICIPYLLCGSVTLRQTLFMLCDWWTAPRVNIVINILAKRGACYKVDCFSGALMNASLTPHLSLSNWARVPLVFQSLQLIQY
jgi:hypothetical protein